MKAMRGFLIVFFLLVLLVLLFENYSSLSMPFMLKADFLLFRWDAPEFPIGAYLLFSFLLGFLCAGLLGLVSRLRLGARLREHERRIREMERIPSKTGETKVVEEGQ